MLTHTVVEKIKIRSKKWGLGPFLLEIGDLNRQVIQGRGATQYGHITKYFLAVAHSLKVQAVLMLPSTENLHS